MTQTQLLLTRGLPGSGKSTFARTWVAESPESRARLNRDDLRAMLHTTYGGFITERAVTIAQHNAANGLLRKGIDVIVDDTNLVARFVKDWLKLAERQNARVVFCDQFLDLSLDECLARDAERAAKGGRSVGADVIRGMFDKHLARGVPPVPTLTDAEPAAKPYDGTPGAPKAVIVDIDGTLALNTSGRSPYAWSKVGDDDVNYPIAQLVDHLSCLGYRIVLMSGRDEVCRDLTLDWLRYADIAGGDFVLYMRPAGDNRRDSLVKIELFDRYVRDAYDVRYVLDDRNQVVRAWRSIGLPVLQVADGDF